MALLEAGSDPVPEGPTRIAYVGTIISEASFHAAVGALNEARAGSPRPVQLEFFGMRGYRGSAWFRPGWMVEHPLYSDSELVTKLQRCSWGLTVMDLEAGDVRYSRFSFPNKVGTCLSAGVPILGVCHQGSSLADAMRRHDIGRFTSATAPSALTSFMTETLRVAEPRAHYRERILHCARTEYDAQKIRQRLWRAWGAKLDGAPIER
jgi:hypothetical protein